jgi:hypothetical protein
MGFRLTSRKTLIAALAMPGVLGVGYYAADPQDFHLASPAEAHVTQDRALNHAPTANKAGSTRVNRTAKTANALVRGKVGSQPVTRSAPKNSRSYSKRIRVASLGGYASEITGAIPRRQALRQTINRDRKADRFPSPASPAPRHSPPAQAVAPTSVLFFASLHNFASFRFPGTAPKPAENQDTAKPKEPVELARGLTYRGETEREYQARQRRCLATAIYFEARGEPVRGQMAVAQVVMNRVRSSIYPDTICGVVFQGQWRRTGCQFSFTCDGRADVPKDKERWLLANKLAKEVTEGKVWLPEIGHASHYHATYVKPKWRRQMDHIKQLGRHIFYKVRYPQIEDALSSEENPAQGLALKQSG